VATNEINVNAINVVDDIHALSKFSVYDPKDNFENDQKRHFTSRGSNTVLNDRDYLRHVITESCFKKSIFSCKYASSRTCMQVPREGFPTNFHIKSWSYFIPIKRHHNLIKFIACCNEHST